MKTISKLMNAGGKIISRQYFGGNGRKPYTRLYILTSKGRTIVRDCSQKYANTY
jgi:hypothetical protein